MPRLIKDNANLQILPYGLFADVSVDVLDAGDEKSSTKLSCVPPTYSSALHGLSIAILPGPDSLPECAVVSFLVSILLPVTACPI